MTRKDYQLIADAIAAEVRDWDGDDRCVAAIGHTASRIASALRRDNPRFNRATFMDACGLPASA